ncbi:hypothetical protein [Lentzea sp.]|uniref:hypothetical protein n=1 Tax=Lentzea sp. TaxID=56099 RepID=UPI002BFE84F6|nr:hypothetical protein [Lentzea sp.]HUQ56120.1 hypothetical protein [Lentzea sp.]
MQSINNNDHACWGTASGSVVTEVTVGDWITRKVRANAPAVEQIPLVVRDSDTVALDSRGITITRGAVVVRFDWVKASIRSCGRRRRSPIPAVGC